MPFLDVVTWIAVPVTRLEAREVKTLRHFRFVTAALEAGAAAAVFVPEASGDIARSSKFCT